MLRKLRQSPVPGLEDKSAGSAALFLHLKMTRGFFFPCLGTDTDTAKHTVHNSCGQLLLSKHLVLQRQRVKEQPPPLPAAQPPAALGAFLQSHQTCLCVLLLLLVFFDGLLDLGPGDFARSDLLGRLPLQLGVLLLQQTLQLLLALQLLQPPLLPLLLEGSKDQVTSSPTPSITLRSSRGGGSNQPRQEQGTPFQDQAAQLCRKRSAGLSSSGDIGRFPPASSETATAWPGPSE